MDPDANLEEQLEIAQQFVECPEGHDPVFGQHDGCDCPVKMERLGELVLALNEWITNGGFLPATWRK